MARYPYQNAPPPTPPNAMGTSQLMGGQPPNSIGDTTPGSVPTMGQPAGQQPARSGGSWDWGGAGSSGGWMGQNLIGRDPTYGQPRAPSGNSWGWGDMRYRGGEPGGAEEWRAPTYGRPSGMPGTDYGRNTMDLFTGNRGGVRTSEFRDFNHNGIDDRDEDYTGSGGFPSWRDDLLGGGGRQPNGLPGTSFGRDTMDLVRGARDSQPKPFGGVELGTSTSGLGDYLYKHGNFWDNRTGPSKSGSVDDLPSWASSGLQELQEALGRAKLQEGAAKGGYNIGWGNVDVGRLDGMLNRMKEQGLMPSSMGIRNASMDPFFKAMQDSNVSVGRGGRAANRYQDASARRGFYEDVLGYYGMLPEAAQPEAPPEQTPNDGGTTVLDVLEGSDPYANIEQGEMGPYDPPGPHPEAPIPETPPTGISAYAGVQPMGGYGDTWGPHPQAPDNYGPLNGAMNAGFWNRWGRR